MRPSVHTQITDRSTNINDVGSFPQGCASEHVRHRHRVQCPVHLLHFFVGQEDVCCLGIFFQAVKFACAGDGDYPRLLAEHPAQGDLRGRGVFFSGKSADELQQPVIFVVAVRLELWHRGAVVCPGIEAAV